MGLMKKAMGALGFGSPAAKKSPRRDSSSSAVLPLYSAPQQELPDEFQQAFASHDSYLREAGDSGALWALGPQYRGSGDGRLQGGGAAIRAMYGPLESPGPSASGTPRGPSCTGGGHGEAPPSVAGALHPHQKLSSPLGRQSHHGNMQLPSPLCTATATPLARHVANRALRKAGDSAPISLPSLTGGLRLRDSGGSGGGGSPNGLHSPGGPGSGEAPGSPSSPTTSSAAPRPPSVISSRSMREAGASPRMRRATTLDVGSDHSASSLSSGGVSPTCAAAAAAALSAPAMGELGRERFHRLQSLPASHPTFSSLSSGTSGPGAVPSPTSHSGPLFQLGSAAVAAAAAQQHPGEVNQGGDGGGDMARSASGPLPTFSSPFLTTRSPRASEADARESQQQQQQQYPATYQHPSHQHAPSNLKPAQLLSPQQQQPQPTEHRHNAQQRRRSEMAMLVVPSPESPQPKLKVAATAAAATSAGRGGGGAGGGAQQRQGQQRQGQADDFYVHEGEPGMEGVEEVDEEGAFADVEEDATDDAVAASTDADDLLPIRSEPRRVPPPLLPRVIVAPPPLALSGPPVAMPPMTISPIASPGAQMITSSPGSGAAKRANAFASAFEGMPLSASAAASAGPPAKTKSPTSHQVELDPDSPAPATGLSSSNPTSPCTAATAATAATPRPPPYTLPVPGAFLARPVPKDGLVHLSSGAPPRMDRPGGSWGVADFKIVRKLYAGYASSVYKATCLHSESDVVLKAYNLMGLSTFLRHQVLRELDIHARLRHASIVQLLAAFKEGDILVLVQEYVRGGSLDRVRRKLGGRMTEFQAMHLVLLPLLNVLQHLHGKGIIHRDIKPENLLFTEDWQLKVCDYGVSVCLHEERAVTRTGSREYMAPEVNVCPLKRGPDDHKDNEQLAYTPAVDVWSLGALMYELLVGFTPFPGGPPAKQAAPGAPAAKALAYPGGVCQEARQFVQACLEVEPMDRPTVQQLLQHPWIQNSLEQDTKPAAP